MSLTLDVQFNISLVFILQDTKQIYPPVSYFHIIALQYYHIHVGASVLTGSHF